MSPPAFVDSLEGARRGDPEGLGDLWRTYHPALLRYLRVRCAPLAEDIASQVWIDVARNIGSFPPDEVGFRRFLFTIAHRRIADEFRRAARQPADLLDELPVEVSPSEDARRDGLDWAIELVRRLPPDQADAVLLRVVADLDVAAVARILHKSEGAVRVLTHRGLHRLAELASPDGGISAEGVTPSASAAMKGAS